MHGTWTPEVIKAVFGGMLGLFMNVRAFCYSQFSSQALRRVHFLQPLVAALVLGVHVANETESLSILTEPAVPAESVRFSSAAKSISHHDEGSRPCHMRIASTTILAKPPDMAKPKLQDEMEAVV